MARRRFGTAFNTVADTLRQVALLQLKEEADNRAAERDAKIAEISRREQAGFNQAQQERQLYGANPKVARRAIDSGVKKAGGMDLTPFAETQGDILGAQLKPINDARSKAELPSATSAVASATAAGLKADPRFAGPFPRVKVGNLDLGEVVGQPIGGERSDIQSLIDALQSKQAEFTSAEEQAARAKPRFDPTSKGMVSERPGMGLVQEGPNAQQSIDIANDTEAGTRGEKLRTSERELLQREALEGGPEKVEAVGPDGKLRFYVIDTRSGQMKPVQGEGRPVPNAGTGQGAKNDKEVAAAMLKDFKTLSEGINTGEGLGQMATGGYRTILSWANKDNPVALMKSMRRSLSIMLASIANNGRPTEPDAQAFEAILPGATTPKELASAFIQVAEKIVGAYDGPISMDLAQSGTGQASTTSLQLIQQLQNEMQAISKNGGGQQSTGSTKTLDEAKKLFGGGGGL